MESMDQTKTTEFNKILAASKTEGDFYTHVSLIQPLGKFIIEYGELENFWYEYQTAILNGEVVGLAETPKSCIPIIADIDIKKIRTFDEYIYSEKHVKSLVADYQNVLKLLLESYDEKDLHCIVLEKGPYIKKANDGTEYLKHGFHLHFPNIFISRGNHETQFIPRIKEQVARNKEFEDIEISDPSSLIDTCYLKASWLLYGSQKNVSAETKPYKISYVLNSKLEKIPVWDCIKHCKIFDADQLEIHLTESNFTFFLPRILSTDIWHRKIRNLKQLPSVLKIKLGPNNVSISRRVYNNSNLSQTMRVVREYLNLIKASRAGNYADWMQIGWALYNVSNGSDEGMSLWIEFSSKCKEKFKEEYCITEWKKMEIRNITERTIRYYAFIDNPEETKKIDSSRVLTNISKILENPTQYDTAVCMKELYGNYYVCANPEGNLWYHYHNNRWKIMVGNSAMSIKLSEDYYVLVNNYCTTDSNPMSNFSDPNVGLNSASNSNAMKTAVEQTKKYGKYLTSLKTSSSKNSILKEMNNVFYRGHEDFIDNLDKNNWLIGFQNGVYDLKNYVFRDGIPEDYITKQIPYCYREFKKDSDIIFQIEDFFAKLFPDSQIRDYFLDVIADLFVAGNTRKHLYFWSGGGDNGKSVCQLLVEKMFGPEYYVKLPTAVLVGKRTQSSAANPELVRICKGTRGAIIQEPDKSEHINVGFIKELTGGTDSVYQRDLFQKSSEIRDMLITAKVSIIVNIPPKAENADQAFWNRVRVIPFEATFSDNPPKTFEEQLQQKIFPKDRQFSEKIPDLIQPLAWYLLERRKLGLKFFEPEKVRNATNKYKNKNDTFGQFLQEKMIVDEKSTISMQILKIRFFEWFKEAKQTRVIPDPEELKEYFIKLHGYPCEKGLWKGKRILLLNEDREEVLKQLEFKS